MSEFIRVSSAEVFEISQEEKIALEGDIGVPERHVQKIGQWLLRFVTEELSRSPDSVMFSGYTQAGAHEKLPQEEFDLDIDSGPLFADDTIFDEQHSEYHGIIEGINGKVYYCFSSAEQLQNPLEAHDNPIHYAGIDADSTIGIYELEALKQLHDDEFFVPANKEAIEAAKLAELHPRFVVAEP